MGLTALLKFFDILPGWVYAAIIAALVVTSGFLLTIERGELALEQKHHADTKLQFERYKTAVANRENERAQQAVVAEEGSRELERNRSKAAQESMNALLNETADTAAASARADERGRVRDRLIDTATRSASCGQASGDPAAVRRAEEAATALGSLLKTCRAEGRSDGAEFETLAGQLRSVISQYQSLLPKESKP